jgi:hypothetical protein
VAAALLAAGAIGGWAMSTTITANATAFEDLSHIEAPREKLQLEASKPSLIGSYVVTFTDSDGKRYAAPGIVGIAVSPWHHPTLLSWNGIMVSKSALAMS